MNERQPIEVSVEIAERLANMAIYAHSEDPVGFSFISKEERREDHGYTCWAIFHRDGDSSEEAWEGEFDVDRRNEARFDKRTFTLTPKRKIVKLVEVITWE